VLVLVGVGLLAWLVSRFPLAQIADACARLGGWVFVTPLICMCWFCANSTRLYYLLARRAPWHALLWNRVVGEGYNALIPAAGLGGEPFKLQLLSRYVDTKTAVVALINDRLIDNGLALGFSATCVGVGAFYYDMSAATRTPMLTYAVGAWIAAIAIAVLALANVTNRLGARIARLAGADQLGVDRLPFALIGRAFLWTAIARAFGLLETALLFTLLGVDVTLGNVAFTAGALAAAGFVGGVIPQGLGVDESACVGIFELLHFGGPAGVAFALARRGRMLVMSVLGVLLHLAFGRRAARGQRTLG
jgi:hypothetical protein